MTKTLVLIKVKKIKTQHQAQMKLKIVTSTKKDMQKNSKVPFYICKNIEFSLKPFEIYKVRKILLTKNYTSVEEIKREGRFKSVIIFNKREETNNTLNDKIFVENGINTIRKDRI